MSNVAYTLYLYQLVTIYMYLNHNVQSDHICQLTRLQDDHVHG